MLFFRDYWKRPLTLNELLEEAENLDVNDEQIPSEIIIFPPDNNHLTDEDSGDEDTVDISNLPGGQLRADAEVNFENTESDIEDDLPLSHFVKRKKMSKPAKEKNEFIWTKNDITSDLPAWDAVCGPKQQDSPVDTLFSFFDDQVMNLLVTYTNLYATVQNRDADVTTDEMRCFIGILLLSGYNCLPRREMYWENSPDTNNKLVCNAMTRNRFRHIMQNLHCCDNANLAADDRFAKLRPLICLLNKKFMDMAPPAEHHSVDESMVPYYGRHPTKQFIRGKPIRWGYKLWTGTNRLGYIEWFEPYQGANTKLSDEYKSLGLGASVVLEFVDTLKASDNKMNYHIFFDNLFSSLPLLSELKSRGVKGTGTIRENRLPKNCPLVSSNEIKKQPRGNFDYATTVDNEIIVCKWHDNSIVNIVSNHATVFPTIQVKRFSKTDKKVILVPQPHIIKIYNENMGGVDRADQNISLYRSSIRGKKWYFPLFTHFVDMAVQNSWRLHKFNGGKLDHLSFRRIIAVGILESFKKKSEGRTSKLPKGAHCFSKFDGVDHLVAYQEKQTRCILCHKKSNFFCKKCTVALHPKDCFQKYHTQD